MNWIRLNFQTLQLMTTCLVIINCESACPSGWFGPQCQYKCHCLNMMCNETGLCTNNFCEMGWFENLCQYQDLVYLPTTTVSADPRDVHLGWLTDDTTDTCNQYSNLKSITVTLEQPHMFTWLQFRVRPKSTVDQVVVQFQTAEKAPKIDCNDRYFYEVKKRRFEVRCNVPDPITKVILSGSQLINLCHLHINGGRNIALKRDTTYEESSQTSLLATSQLAVDGNTSPRFEDNTCAHWVPAWKLELKNDFRITRIILYNRLDYGNRLHNFAIDGYNAKNESVFYYQYSGSVPLPFYHILNKKWKQPLRTLVITSNNGHDALALCEVETFGECPLDTTKLECESCHGKCHHATCNRYGDCPFGCVGATNPPYCTQACPPTKWGINCTSSCSKNCLDSCDKQTGICGCNGYSNPPICDKECPRHKWGLNCNESCSDSCYNSLCDRINGVCTHGCNGYRNQPLCNAECLPGTWGRDCNSSCSIFCLSDTYCNRQSGFCEEAITLKQEDLEQNRVIILCIGLGVGLIVVLLLLCVIYICRRLRRKRRNVSKKIGN